MRVSTRVAPGADRVAPRGTREAASRRRARSRDAGPARGAVDDGFAPLACFLDSGGPDAIAATVETNLEGSLYPVMYLRRGGSVEERSLPGHPVNDFGTAEHRLALASLLAEGGIQAGESVARAAVGRCERGSPIGRGVALVEPSSCRAVFRNRRGRGQLIIRDRRRVRRLLTVGLPNMISFKKLVAMPIVVATLVAGCSSGATTAAPIQNPASPTTAIAGLTSAPAAGGATVATATTSAGIVLVAGSNGMTVYTFASDTANSGTSGCSGGCAIKWPPLTVPAGTAPSKGAGVTGTLGTITRADTGALQVTYNGLPLYFYAGDHAAGDTNGNYPGWSSVKP